MSGEQLLRKIHAEWEWYTYTELRHLRATVRSNITVAGNSKAVLLERLRETGRMDFAAISVAATNWTIRLEVDERSVVFPTIAQLTSSGNTAPNKAVSVKQVGGVRNMYVHQRFPYNDHLKVEAWNKGSSSGTLLASEVLDRQLPEA